MVNFQDGQPPVELTMGLTMDLAAMSRQPQMTEAQKEEILNRARDAKSSSERKQILEELR